MTTTTAPPATLEVVAFYTAARPLVEQLATLAREWRDTASEDALPAAIEAHAEYVYAAIRLDLRLSRCRRDLTGPGCPNGASSAAVVLSASEQHPPRATPSHQRSEA